MHKNNLPIIGITMGDPIGIGPEIIVKTLSERHIHQICRPLVFGDPHVMVQAAQLLESTLAINNILSTDQATYKEDIINVYHISNLTGNFNSLSTPTKETGTAMQNYILSAIRMAMQKQIEGIATCPITKTAMKLAGSKFHGHTELLAHHTQTTDYSMMLAGKRLKVVLVTIHIPLNQVSKSINIDNIFRTISMTHNSLKSRFGIPTPRIAVAGLNPHSGEDAMFGDEESRIIEPAVKQACDNGFCVKGPLPPDTVFYHAVNQQFDAVVCMYHDQGLIPFKLVHFKDGVNTTLGLPIIRTSVDHGTAYDIAWKGIADHTSLMEALKMAALQANQIKE